MLINKIGYVTILPTGIHILDKLIDMTDLPVESSVNH